MFCFITQRWGLTFAAGNRSCLSWLLLWSAWSPICTHRCQSWGENMTLVNFWKQLVSPWQGREWQWPDLIQKQKNRFLNFKKLIHILLSKLPILWRTSGLLLQNMNWLKEGLIETSGRAKESSKAKWHCLVNTGPFPGAISLMSTRL